MIHNGCLPRIRGDEGDDARLRAAFLRDDVVIYLHVEGDPEVMRDVNHLLVQGRVGGERSLDVGRIRRRHIRR